MSAFKGFLEGRDGFERFVGIGKSEALAGGRVPLLQIPEEGGFRNGAGLFEAHDSCTIECKEGLGEEKFDVYILRNSIDRGFEDPSLLCNKIGNPVSH